MRLYISYLPISIPINSVRNNEYKVAANNATNSVHMVITFNQAHQ